jgi:hypothetical protein
VNFLENKNGLVKLFGCDGDPGEFYAIFNTQQHDKPLSGTQEWTFK